MESCELLELKSLPVVCRDETIVEEFIDTGFGPVLVARQGASIRQNISQCCILTFHDLALNYVSNFQAYFNHPRMRPVIKRMPVIHINAPGQEDNADELPSDYEYPTMNQLAESVRTVCNYYGVRQAICFGVGLGANVMSRVAAKNPDIVDGLFVVNPVPDTAGWIEWAYQKKNIYYLNSISSGLTQLGEDYYSKTFFPQNVLDYLTWYHFGNLSEERNSDLVNMYKSYFSSLKIRPRNLALLIESYLKRDDIGISRSRGMICPALVLVGNDSPFLEDSINMNQRLKPEYSNWMKLFDCSLPLDEQPHKVAEAFILFVQGLGLGLLTCYKYK